MLSQEELAALFTDQESDRVERKSSLSDPSKVKQAICAIANDLAENRIPGVVFIGQRDDLSCANILIDDDLLKKLSYFRNDGQILPFPVISVRKVEINGCTIAAICVAPHDRPPVRLEGRTWIRVGPRRAIATVDEEKRLTERQLWRNLPFDSRPFSGATLDDLDMHRFELEFVPAAFTREINAEDSRNLADKLCSLRLLSKAREPTAAALLMLAKESRGFFPGSYVQFVRYEGTALLDLVVDHKEISGSIADQIARAEELVRLNIRNSSTIEGHQRSDRADYPFSALQQLIRNALLHRNFESHTPTRIYWFSDRVEIHNPGGLYGEVTPETIWKNVTSYRNPLLAETLKAMGLVERFGFGMAKIKNALEQNRNPPLETEFAMNAVVFKVQKSS